MGAEGGLDAQGSPLLPLPPRLCPRQHPPRAGLHVQELLGFCLLGFALGLGWNLKIPLLGQHPPRACLHVHGVSGFSFPSFWSGIWLDLFLLG